MRINILKEFKEWVELFGTEVPHNVVSVYNMLNEWKCTDINELPARLAQKNYAQATYSNRKNIIRRFITYLLSRRKIKHDPFIGIVKPKLSKQPNKNLRVPFTDEELIKIFTAFEKHKKYYSYLKFLALTGARPSEAMGLQVCKIDFEKKTILINAAFGVKMHNLVSQGRKLKGTKTDSERYLYMHEDLESVLSPLCYNRKPQDFVFRSVQNKKLDMHNFVRRVFKPMLKDLGIPERDLYAFRHTFGTICIEQGIDPLTTGHLMGHSNARTVVQHYAKKRNIVMIMPKIGTK